MTTPRPNDSDPAAAAALPPDDAEAASGLRLLKGTDDRLPEVQIVRNDLIRVLREVFELHGFSPAETPILHHFDILASKYAGGAEILKETYKLVDQGGRELGLRYDLTVPFARMIGMNHRGAIRLPFKRYEIGRVFRDGPVRLGRRREFMQCDVDVVGVSSMWAEAELIALAAMVFERLGLRVRCELNHRELLTALILIAKVPKDSVVPVILAVDKLDKVGVPAVRVEILDLGISSDAADSILRDITRTEPENSSSDPFMSHYYRLQKQYHTTSNAGTMVFRAFDQLEEMFAVLNTLGVKVRPNPALARGLTIYTGPVFEFFLEDQSVITGAVAAGGRYDRIIGDFLAAQGEAVESPDGSGQIPAVGFSFGLEPLTEVLLARDAGAAARRRSVTEVLVVSMGADDAALRLCADLRARGVRTEIEMRRDVRMKKSLQWADANGIPFVAILGENEVKAGTIALKTLAAGTQDSLPLAEVVARVEAWRAGK